MKTARDFFRKFCRRCGAEMIRIGGRYECPRCG